MSEPKYPVPCPGALDMYMIFSDKIDLALLVSVCKGRGCIMLGNMGISQHYRDYAFSEFRKLTLD